MAEIKSKGIYTLFVARSAALGFLCKFLHLPFHTKRGAQLLPITFIFSLSQHAQNERVELDDSFVSPEYTEKETALAVCAHAYIHANKKGMRSVTQMLWETSFSASKSHTAPVALGRNQCINRIFSPLDVWNAVCQRILFAFSSYICVLLLFVEGTMPLEERMCALKKGAKWVLTIGRERRLAERCRWNFKWGHGFRPQHTLTFFSLGCRSRMNNQLLQPAFAYEYDVT